MKKPTQHRPHLLSGRTIETTEPLHRSGAVARMLGMPVATLRVWERRYSVTDTALSEGGQRLYAAADVHRLGLIKQLTEHGHAIGSLAGLGLAQLQGVAATHAHTRAAARTTDRAFLALGPGSPPAPQIWRLAVVGPALAGRLQQPALLRQLGRPVQLLGPFENAAHAAAALQGQPVDALLLHAPQLHADWLPALESQLANAPTLLRARKAALYGFASDAVCEALATAGVALLREPQPDVVLAQWLCSLSLARALPGAAALPASRALPARRWTDAALADFARRSTTVACECPRHVVELLVQLAHFETYSAQCQQRSVADARLHAHLREVAAQARLSFESALGHVALHEGLPLPDLERASLPAA